MGEEEHTTHARSAGQRPVRRSDEPTAEQVRQLILAGEPTFSRPKRFPKGSVRITPQPGVPYFELVEQVAIETRRAAQPSFAELARTLVSASLLVFTIALAILVAAR